MRIFLNIIGGLIVLTVLASMIAAIGGTFMDPDHQATVTAHLNVPPDSIFTVITDYSNYPLWRKELLKVELLPPRDTISVWREFDKEKSNWAFEAVEVEAPFHIKINIAEPNAPVQGSWTISIVPEGDGSSVNVIEEGTINNIFFRFLGSLFYSQTASIESYLTSLAARFGQKLEFK